MSVLFLSEILEVVDNPVDILIDRVSMDVPLKLTVSKFSSSDEFIEDLIPPTTYVENGGCAEDKTRIRVFLDENQLSTGEKIQIKLEN